jgi:hypothetical protein
MYFAQMSASDSVFLFNRGSNDLGPPNRADRQEPTIGHRCNPKDRLSRGPIHQQEMGRPEVPLPASEEVKSGNESGLRSLPRGP